MSWFELNSDEYKSVLDFTKPETQAVVIHASLDDASSLNIKTETDWPIVMIGIGSILASIVTIIVSYVAQRQQSLANAAGLKNQVRANAAGFRNEWMGQLRSAVSEFLQCASLVVTGLQEEGRDEGRNAELTELKHRALYLQVKIKLYVGVTSENAKQINDVSEWIVKDLDNMIDQDVKAEDVYDRLTEMEELVVRELEHTWNQVKDDLGLPNNLNG
ncbi:hypothetical protein QVM48_25555 [Pseudomonas soli]|uniref:hypothetical protein n=1 Tax=Pseudomonas soli TaxID=1306993 RepID=UPI0028949EA9|nr:hypothetical protein [Pseudomonas soli]MDT3712764.1 hypothetical protein [Pseudomonas soli]MDT3730101.1 hypothetical protein [Pseudomonas soli]